MAEEDEEAPDERNLAGAEGAAAADRAAEEEDPFEGMVEGVPGSFWTAVADELIEQPELLGWNDWQAWRRTEGGLPKGVRDSAVQQREVALYQAAMKRYRGLDFSRSSEEHERRRRP